MQKQYNQYTVISAYQSDFTSEVNKQELPQENTLEQININMAYNKQEIEKENNEKYDLNTYTMDDLPEHYYNEVQYRTNDTAIDTIKYISIISNPIEPDDYYIYIYTSKH